MLSASPPPYNTDAFLFFSLSQLSLHMCAKSDSHCSNFITKQDAAEAKICQSRPSTHPLTDRCRWKQRKRRKEVEDNVPPLPVPVSVRGPETTDTTNKPPFYLHTGREWSWIHREQSSVRAENILDSSPVHQWTTHIQWTHHSHWHWTVNRVLHVFGGSAHTEPTHEENVNSIQKHNQLQRRPWLNGEY